MDYTRWVNVSGQIIDIKIMTDEYIENCSRMILNGSQKNGSLISKEWIDKHGLNYLRQFKVELDERKELRDARSTM